VSEGSSVSEGERTGVADRLHALLVHLFGAAPKVTVEAWDGSRVETDADVVVRVQSRKAIRRLLWAPGELSVARAYVLGELDVDGDFALAVHALSDYADVVGPNRTLDPAGRREVLRTTVLLGAVGPAPRTPDIALVAVGGYAPAGAEMLKALEPAITEVIFGDSTPVVERPALEALPTPGESVTQHYVTSPQPLSALLRDWEAAGLELVSAENVSEEYAAVLRGWSAGLARQWDQVVTAAGEQQARVWRMSLALDAEHLRRRRIFGYRLTARR